eukprot:TRINITY_DN20361_c0_g1_i1.p1 TRINITY_DN20361_c0_g1~~TRINITY_DN20361_c0_g1_i1.p1  ORF type:complete len:447 (-),score=91.10 TRINITY_DN20361_c0_g1_i1:287-1627(-)
MLRSLVGSEMCIRDRNKVCAGFRQCGSTKGVDGGAAWDVPLELRCANDSALTGWSESPEYLFNVSWWRPIPYDPARPWVDTDGKWYVMLSMDGCNTTTKQLPCHEGGQLMMWSSPALRGPTADWQQVGPVFTSNATVLKDGFLSKEFVTIDFIGSLEGDAFGDTRIFLNNVGGNGGGDGCCDGTTSWFPFSQSAPGQPFKVEAPGQGMVDWGSFSLKPSPASGTFGVDLLTGVSSRGLSMARTLGSEDANQVTVPGRRTLIGWTGPADGAAFKDAAGVLQGSAQALPRDLSLNSNRELLQRFVPELEMLRALHTTRTDTTQAVAGGLRAEVVARIGSGGGSVTVLGDGTSQTKVEISLLPSKGLVTVNATSLGNTAVRAGPLPQLQDNVSEWSVHAMIDHSIIEIIVSNMTALVVYAAPDASCPGLVALGQPKGTLDVWTLNPANN